MRRNTTITPRGARLGGLFAGLALILGACGSAAGSEMPAPPAVPVTKVMRVETMAQPPTASPPPVTASPYACGQQVAVFKARLGQPPGAVAYPEVRLLPPDAMATPDFSPARLNIYLDRHGNITAARCG